MAWPTKAQREAKQSVPLHELFPAEAPEQPSHEAPASVAAPETPEPVEDEQTISMLIRAQEAIRLRAQQVLDRRAAQAQEERAKELAEVQALEEASRELARLQAQEAAEQAAKERVRIADALAEYWAEGHLERAAEDAVQTYVRQTSLKDNGEEACREIFYERLRIPAPPAEAWTMSDPLFGEIVLPNGEAKISVDARPGMDIPKVFLTSITGEPLVGYGVLDIVDRGVLGRWLSDYGDVAQKQLGITLGTVPVEAPKPPLDISAFGSVA